MTRIGSAIVLILSATSCNRPEGAHVQAAGPSANSSSAAASVVPAATPPAIAAAPTVTKTSKLETVSVNTEPYCRKAAGPGATDQGDAGSRPNSPWLADKAVQEKLRVLDEELKPHAASLIGITFEDEPRTAVVVLYPSFTAYADLQAKLAPRVKPLPVALRSGCHTAEQLAEALEVLRGRAWHPKASTTPVGWHLDAAFSAYAVVVDDSGPEVAEALRKKLGVRVLVTLGKPRRHALGAGSAGS